MNKHNTEHMRDLLEKIERLEAENRDMREGLSFYAVAAVLTMIQDGGRRAREVLAKWGEK
jgi:hypothetical protein